MNYKFPEIQHIDEIRPYIDEEAGFYEKETPHGILVNYGFVSSATFPSIQTEREIFQREFRGLVFNKHTGYIIRRPLHKFFNLNEKEETRSISLANTHVIESKLDGSLIAPFINHNGEIIWASKSISEDFHNYVESFVWNSPIPYLEYAHDCISDGFTPIFELCSNYNPIVVNYPEPTLTLIAERDMITGEYIDSTGPQSEANLHSIPIIKTFIVTDDIGELQEIVKNTEGEEGCVICFADGHRIKVKSDWYIQLHKVKSYFSYEKDVAKLILSNNDDDLMSILTDEQRAKLNQYKNELLFAVEKVYTQTTTMAIDIVRYGMTRKVFSLTFPQGKVARSVIFTMFDDVANDQYSSHQIRGAIVKMLIDNTSSASKWDQAKKDIGLTAQW